MTRRLGFAPIEIEAVATLFPTMPRNACAVVTALLCAQGRVLSPWTLADAVADATGNAPSTGAVRSAVQIARRHGAVITTRRGLGYQMREADGHDVKPSAASFPSAPSSTSPHD